MLSGLIFGRKVGDETQLQSAITCPYWNVVWIFVVFSPTLIERQVLMVARLVIVKSPCMWLEWHSVFQFECMS